MESEEYMNRKSRKQREGQRLVYSSSLSREEGRGGLGWGGRTLYLYVGGNVRLPSWN